LARIFPDAASRQGNPVRANEQVLVPEGTAWYGLDQYKGTEQVLFIASRQPRPDIEGSLTQLAQTSRASLSREFRPVREPALPDPASRGLVRVQMSAPTFVRSETGQQYSFTPQAFATPGGRGRHHGDEVVQARVAQCQTTTGPPLRRGRDQFARLRTKMLHGARSSSVFPTDPRHQRVANEALCWCRPR